MMNDGQTNGFFPFSQPKFRDFVFGSLLDGRYEGFFDIRSIIIWC